MEATPIRQRERAASEKASPVRSLAVVETAPQLRLPETIRLFADQDLAPQAGQPETVARIIKDAI